MADQFKIQEAITFVQQTPPETFRLMDVTIENLPDGYEHGKVTIPAETTDMQVADQVNIFVMYSTTAVTVKLGTSVSTALTGVTHLSYKGSKTDVFISNAETEDISIKYATCTI
jgi:hypothetical protein